jgi:hypothetical protein
MEALSSSETSVLTRATWRNIQEDGILHDPKHSQRSVTVPCISQVLQVNQAGQMLHSGGQQIMVHAVPQGAQTIQVATQSGQALQQIQVVPVSSLQVCSCTRQKLFLNRTHGPSYSLLIQVAGCWLNYITHTGDVVAVANSSIIWQCLFKLLI